MQTRMPMLMLAYCYVQLFLHVVHNQSFQLNKTVTYVGPPTEQHAVKKMSLFFVLGNYGNARL